MIVKKLEKPIKTITWLCGVTEGKEKDFQKLADANKSYSISAREANNRDYEENKKKAIEAERVAVDKCTFSLRIEMDEEAKREYYRGLCKKKFGINRDL